jgi:Protein of unknown function (DUF3703)
MRREAMPTAVCDAYTAQMVGARTATGSKARWRHLERAHILSQPWPHVRNHVAMFALAIGELAQSHLADRYRAVVVGKGPRAAARIRHGAVGQRGTGAGLREGSSLGEMSGDVTGAISSGATSLVGDVVSSPRPFV